MKLDRKGTDNYYVNNPRPFVGIAIARQDIQRVIDFAYAMCFGDGHHRNHRTGGQYGRKAGEKFCNTFQGKLGEVLLYVFFKSNGLESKEPDFEIYGEGKWDDSDLEIKNKKINVKSAASQSNLLLLETNDWNIQGHYIPNLLSNNGSTFKYDYFILVRIQPDIKKLFSAERLMYNNEIEKEVIEKLIFGQNWNYDIAGYCTHSELVTTIANGYVLPQNSTLNHYTKMDASNFYIQSGNMGVIDDLVNELKAIP
ncbi:hypothetical protein NLG42_11145 [Flavobacterium plurextorum]|uniref:hypothetical protein n=1 Tax=Flavobacterium TaxID=237 RepID=UPI00214D1A34|nr:MULTISPECIES: hypothetical protein [Flavobacterium]UUW11339.1 hypothetical protein NLG42_11145 [Flavobacterium plurextorum]